MNRLASTRDLFDRVAIGLSALCLVHCAASVVLVTVLATAGGFMLDPAIHEIGLGLAMLLGVVGLGSGFFYHRRAVPLVIGAVGITMMGIALVGPHGYGETVYTMSGVVCVGFAHLLNRRAHAGHHAF